MLHHSKSHVLGAVTHEAITLWTKSKHRSLENLSANLPIKFEAFTAITQKLVLFLVNVQRLRAPNIIDTITTQIPIDRNHQLFKITCHKRCSKHKKLCFLFFTHRNSFLLRLESPSRSWIGYARHAIISSL